MTWENDDGMLIKKMQVTLNKWIGYDSCSKRGKNVQKKIGPTILTVFFSV